MELSAVDIEVADTDMDLVRFPLLLPQMDMAVLLERTRRESKNHFDWAANRL